MTAVVLMLSLLVSQASASITEAQARAAASVASKEAGSDERKWTNAYQRELRLIDKAFGARDVVSVYYSEALTIALVGPAVSFGWSASERARKMEDVSDTDWPKGVVLYVSPKQIDAPDIEKIVVTRDGKSVEPLDDKLASQELETRMGVKVSLHAGTIVYPWDAFAPGGSVTITAIPKSGNNIVKKLTDRNLRDLK